MDKYTVDLDKVLNDFEYSEYSLESAKVNRNIQQENPNTSFTKSEAPVKHSINNVFHSLNEYLNSDITPKKIETVHKTTNNVDFSKRFEPACVSQKIHPVDNNREALVNLDGSNGKQIVPQGILVNNSQVPVNLDYKKVPEDVLVNRFDSFSENCAIKENSDRIEAPTNIFDNNKHEMPEIEENMEENTSETKDLPNGTVEGILVDFSTETPCDTIPSLNTNPEEKEKLVDIEKEDLKNEETVIQNESIETEKTTTDEIRESKEELNSISDSKSIENNDKKQKVIDISKKIGFEVEFELYGEDIELYFQELEKEFCNWDKEDPEMTEIKKEETNSENINFETTRMNTENTPSKPEEISSNSSSESEEALPIKEEAPSEEMRSEVDEIPSNFEALPKIESISSKTDGTPSKLESPQKIEENALELVETSSKLEALTKIESISSKREKTSSKSEASQQIEEIAVKVEEIPSESEAHRKIEETALKLEEIPSELEAHPKIESISSKREKTPSKSEEPQKFEDTTSKIEEVSSKLEETSEENEKGEINKKENAIEVQEDCEEIPSKREETSSKLEVPPKIEETSSIVEEVSSKMEEENEENTVEGDKKCENEEVEIEITEDKVLETQQSAEEEAKKEEKLEESITQLAKEEETEISECTEESEDVKKEDTNEIEAGKNSRPQQLSLSEETQETARKIDLIGEPGSTPYNNLYKDFSKTVGANSGRAASPTYSDVSTNSVSSSSTSGDADWRDAENGGEKTKEEIVQNNLVRTGETSRSDVTMDKDFKNNLKSVGVKTDEEAAGGSSEGGLEEGAWGLDVEAGVGGHREEEEVIGEPRNTTGIDWLGKQAPLWIPDSEAMSCLHCDMKFTVIKRRHHCRACGLVLCSKCCNLKYRLEYLNSEARVCVKCFEILDRSANSNSDSEQSQDASVPVRTSSSSQDNLGQPNPNNPLEYCSTVPPTQQVDLGASASVPSVMVPVGVLKRKGSNKGRSNKSVMFCDGIRPGSDLTNLDTDFNYSENQKSEKTKKSLEKPPKTGRNLDMLDSETKSFIPSDANGLPPTVTIFKTDIKYSPCSNNSSLVETLKNETLTFALQSNVFVHVKIINMDCCVSRIAWCFSTEGLINVGNDEIVVLLEFKENESTVPKDVFVHLNYVYLEAVKGSSVKELGMSLHPSSPFLGSKNHFGLIYIRPTFQCLQNVIIPKEPYLVGILIHRWETPWAKLFPLRLILRLGAEYKYYPSPVISTRDRDSVFVEIGHTIINLLADFRNFSYTLPQIRGLTIHMEDKNTTVTIPKNRFDQVLKSLSNSSDHILAFAGNFSTVADSHLVCIQDTQSASNNYSTHAINICNQPRKVTGASFIVFNGALKSTSGLTAKSNIVEDGLMIQILPEHMLQVRDSLKNMRNHTIKCGCVNEESDETVTIVWGEADASFNIGVFSPIDNKELTGIPSIRVHNGKDYTCNSGNRLIRWTEVFISQAGDETPKNQESIDISKISENISKATCQALVKYLDLLVSNSFYKIGLRAHIHVENVSYSAGSNNVKLPPIYMKSLDNELIPVLHRIASNNVTEQPIVLELIFRILNI